MTGNPSSEKKKIRFSVLDLVVILLLLACAAGIAVRYNLVGKLFSRTKPVAVTVSFLASDLSEEEADTFTPGALLYRDGLPFGEVIASESDDAVFTMENSAGMLITYEREGRYSVTGTLRCSLLDTDEGFFFPDGTFLSAGAEFLLKSGGASIHVLITGAEFAAEST